VVAAAGATAGACAHPEAKSVSRAKVMSKVVNLYRDGIIIDLMQRVYFFLITNWGGEIREGEIPYLKHHYR
jgi:hypothetical protein